MTEFSDIIDTCDFCDDSQPGNLTDCHAVQRIAVILDCYKDWCQDMEKSNDDALAEYRSEVFADQQLKNAQPEADKDDEDDGFYSYMAGALDYASDAGSISVKLFNDYNHLLLHHNSTADFESLYEFYIQHIYGNKGCNYDACSMLERNNRDRNEVTEKESKRTRLYHGYSSSHEVVVQQTVDRIHSHYFHSYDLGFKLTRKERERIVNMHDTDNDDDDDEMEANDDEKEIHDELDEEEAILGTTRLRTVCEILTKKRQRDSRGRRNNGHHTNTNKFTTNIIEDEVEEKNQKMVNAEEFEDDQDEQDEEKQSATDTDSSSNKASKKKEATTAASKASNRDIVLRSREVEAIGDKYSFSYRYYYWKAYLQTHANDEKTRGRGLQLQDEKTYKPEPGNPGYHTWDWYIAKKYTDLKTEITQNTCSVIGIQQWNDCTVKAEGYMQSEEIGKKLKSYGEWMYDYEIPDDTPIRLEHIMALLLYCNFDVLQAKFSATFRRLSREERDDSMIKRHREYANWGRYLREAVELYGDNIDGQYTDENGEIKYDKSIKKLKFYHGINCELLFPRTIARFNGPTSTTVAIAVAMSFTSSSGLCLRLKRKDPEYKHSTFFNCVPLSDFTYEEERFFIGGFEPLQISTIIETKTNTNYSRYIRALNNIQNFIEGFNDGWAIHKVTNRMKKDIEEMFDKYSMQKYDAKQCKVPEYILNLFRAYANCVRTVDLNLEAINSEQSIQGKLGFQNIRDLILTPLTDEYEYRQWVKLDYVGNVFRKVAELHIRSGHSVNMVKLDKELMGELVGFIRSNNVIERFHNLTKIYIYHPEQSALKLEKAVKLYKGECNKHGWILSFEQRPKVRILKLDRKKDEENNHGKSMGFMSKIKNIVNK